LISFRFQGLPAWLAWFAVIAALATALRIGSVFETDGVFASDGVLGFWAGLVAFAAWILAASVTLVEALGRTGGDGGIFGRVRGAVTGAATGAAAGAGVRRND
jgi:hypothetical protein